MGRMKNFSLMLVVLLGLSAPAFPKNDFVPVPTLAILYFDNATGVEHLSWLPKGFAELLIRDVEKTGRVRTVSRKKVEEGGMTYAGTKSTAFSNKLMAARLGKILGASHILTGRFTRHDTDLVIELKLYETREGKQIGWRQVEGPSDDLMYLEKQVGIKIFEMMKVQLADREFIDLLQIPTASTKAFAYYSMGLDAIDHDDRDLARAHFRSSLDADRFFRPAADAISGMAFVLSGKAIVRAALEDTAVIGTAGIKTASDLLDLARTNAFDFSIGDPVLSAIEGDTLRANVRVPLHLSVRPDFVNLWLYSIRRIGREMSGAKSARQLTVGRSDLFDAPVVLSLPDALADEWLSGWQNLKMHLVFLGKEGATLFETPKVPVLPLYIGNAEGQFAGQSSVYWQVDTAFDVERVPKQFFDDPIQVSLEIDR